MKFWIVTPSYNQLDWLKCCIASVRDQVATEGDAVNSDQLSDDLSSDICSLSSESESPIRVHHHIQDAQSTDGTPEWLAEYTAQQPATSNYQLTFASEADEGMYDAINKGWKLAPDDVDVIAHLNCDEQYLPSALKTIAGFMTTHPKADVVLADMIVVDSEGQYICHRRSLKPYRLVSLFYTGGFTATTFHRASVTREKNVFFDLRWKNVGDKVWYNALHTAKCRFGVLHAVISVFTDTGENLNWTKAGRAESERYRKEFLFGTTFGGWFFTRINGIRRYLLEFFLPSPVSYQIYTNKVEARVERVITKPTGLWHKKQ